MGCHRQRVRASLMLRYLCSPDLPRLGAQSVVQELDRLSDQGTPEELKALEEDVTSRV